MAYTILWCDGFDEIGNIDQKYASTTERNVSMSTNTSSPAYSYGRALTLINGWFGKTLPGAPFTALFVAFDVMLRAGLDFTDNPVFQFWDALAGAVQVDIRAILNRAVAGWDLRLRRGSTDLLTWPGVLIYQFWHHVSIKVVISPVSGSVELAVDGIPLASFTGNTQNTANTRVDQFRASMSNTNRVWMDNLVVATGLDTDPLLPPSRVYGGLVPNANVAVSWTPSSGSNWQTVDEIPPGDSDYNQTSTAGAQDVFSHAALSSVGNQILGVKVNTRAWTDTSDQQQHLVRVGGTDYYGPNYSPSSSFFGYGNIWQNNPATLLPWTPSEAASAGFGYRRV